MSQPHNTVSQKPGGAPLIRTIQPGDLDFVREQLVRNWQSTRINSLGVWHDAEKLPGFVATTPDGQRRLGLLTHTPPEAGGGCEVITLSSSAEGGGVGSRLLESAVHAARAAGCVRVYLTTTNDNIHAIGFYQKRGWSLVAVHRDAMTIARRIKPSIPLIGMNGIPLRDEIEIELRLQ